MQPHITQPRSFPKSRGAALEATGMETCHLCPAIPACWWLLTCQGEALAAQILGGPEVRWGGRWWGTFFSRQVTLT